MNVVFLININKVGLSVVCSELVLKLLLRVYEDLSFTQVKVVRNKRESSSSDSSFFL